MGGSEWGRGRGKEGIKGNMGNGEGERIGDGGKSRVIEVWVGGSDGCTDGGVWVGRG